VIINSITQFLNLKLFHSIKFIITLIFHPSLNLYLNLHFLYFLYFLIIKAYLIFLIKLINLFLFLFIIHFYLYFLYFLWSLYFLLCLYFLFFRIEFCLYCKGTFFFEEGRLIIIIVGLLAEKLVGSREKFYRQGLWFFIYF
jgi:hypothetical protein